MRSSLATADGLDFDALQQRLHPAESRVNRLAAETPASFVAFDLLALDDGDLRAAPLRERRELLEAGSVRVEPPLHLTPSTLDRTVAADWFVRFEGAGLDGVIAKPLDGTYQPDKRVQFKVKHKRTADCVVAGFRMHKSGDGVGSLLLGLYDDSGHLHHVGVATSFTAKRRVELVDEIAPYRDNALDDHPVARLVDAEAARHERRSHARRAQPVERQEGPVVGAAARRSSCARWLRAHAGRSLPARHAAVRWRPDKDPADCNYEQLETVAPYELVASSERELWPPSRPSTIPSCTTPTAVRPTRQWSCCCCTVSPPTSRPTGSSPGWSRR